MTHSVVAPKRSIKRTPKVKSGCGTCRIRKIKCDENKPNCQKCVSTGRTCDGYESLFRPFSGSKQRPDAREDVFDAVSTSKYETIEITSQDIALLNRYFSIKTLFKVELGCDEEAKHILQASLTDPSVRHAIASLRALRKDLETSGDGPESVSNPTPTYQYGLEQYSIALRGLASNLSSSDPKALRSALLCCQLMISIEQVRKNFAAMGQHIVGGLKIMHEHHARPYLTTGNRLAAAHPGQLPFLDVFVIRLFAAPCKFADLSVSPPMLTHQSSTSAQDFRIIAPNMRTDLLTIADWVLEFLKNVAQAESADRALQLLSEKAALLENLDLWVTNLDLVQTDPTYPCPEPIPASFLRLFHQTLKIVLLGALETSPDLPAKLRNENKRLQEIADNINERVRDYVTYDGVGGDG